MDSTEAPSECGDGSSSLLLGWGSGEFAQHGHGLTGGDIHVNSSIPPLIESACWGITKFISCGSSHSAIVTDDSQCYTWGNGSSGQLGCGDKKTHEVPQKVVLPSTKSLVAGVACGGRHTIWWSEDGRCYGTGNNFYAQLEYDFSVPNYRENQISPCLLRPVIHQRIIQVSCGEKHSLFLSDTGLVLACGCNEFGQLGTGSWDEVVSPRVIEDLEGRIVTSIACGQNHSLAVTDNGGVFAWGFGRACGSRCSDIFSPIQKALKSSNVIAVAGGSSHSMALSSTGQVYTWGGGTVGQLGLGPEELYLTEPVPLPQLAFRGCRISLVSCAESYSTAVTADGDLYVWGKNSRVLPSKVAFFVPMLIRCQFPIKELACGAWHAIAITGRPAWQPETDYPLEEADMSSKKENLVSEISQLDHEQSFSEHGCGSPARKKCGNPSRTSKALSLAEFYAPSPLPAISPISQEGDVQNFARAITDPPGDVKGVVCDGERLVQGSVVGSRTDLGSEKSGQSDGTKSSGVKITGKNTEINKNITRSGSLHMKSLNNAIGDEQPSKLYATKITSAKTATRGATGELSMRAQSFPVHRRQRQWHHLQAAKARDGPPTASRRSKVAMPMTNFHMDVQLSYKNSSNGTPTPILTRAHTFYGGMSSASPKSKASVNSSLSGDTKSLDERMIPKLTHSRTFYGNAPRQAAAQKKSPHHPREAGRESSSIQNGEINTIRLLTGLTNKPKKLVESGSGHSISGPQQKVALYSSASSWRNGDQFGRNVLK